MFFKNNLFPIFLLAIISLLLIFFQLGTPSLWQGDEGIYAEIAREMLESGDLITPHYNYVPRFDKPPLYFWLTALIYPFFGFASFAVRFWPAIFGLATVFLVFFLGKKIWNSKVGLCSALIFLTSFQNVVQSRVAVMDTMLTFWFLLSIYLFLHWYDSKKWCYFYYAAIAMGFATLTKGPIGFLFPGLVLVISLIVRKELNLLFNKRIILAILIFFIVTLPWYIAVYMANGMSFISDFFCYQNIARYTKAIEQHGAPWYFYFLVVLFGFFPWVTFLLFPIIELIKKTIFLIRGNSKTKEYPFAILFLAIWTFFVFIFFSFSQSKLPGYVFPIFPVLSLFVGRSFLSMFYFEGKDFKFSSPRTKSLFRISIILFLIFLGIFLAVFFISFVTNPPSETPFDVAILWPLIWIFAIALVLIFILFFLKPFWCFYVMLVMSFAFWSVIIVSVLPKLEVYKSVNLASKYARDLGLADSKIGVFGTIDARHIFYSQRKIDKIKNIDDLLKYLQNKNNYVILERSKYLDLISSNQIEFRHQANQRGVSDIQRQGILKKEMTEIQFEKGTNKNDFTLIYLKGDYAIIKNKL